ncbi:MAG TPA: VWA domain-containing protein [Candidatus Binatia bacterium]|nr:VWA domain-containing protein [Candidatus Binatia bacterium]
MCLGLTLCCGRSTAQGTPENGSTSSVPAQHGEEIASHDQPATLKVNVKLVVIRAVVRDAQGHPVGNLHKEDFEIFDKGKPQVISQFEVEQPGTRLVKAQQDHAEEPEDIAAGVLPAPASTAVLPERFVAFLFDDVHLEFGDLARVREAAERHLATLRPTDRVAVFTTSGQNQLDFTDDRAKLRDALLHLQPRPIVGQHHDCPDIGYYQADLIVNKNDLNARGLAVQEAIDCAPRNQQGQPVGNPAATVDMLSQAALAEGDHESLVAMGVLKGVVGTVARMPGQRSVVLISPGFIVPTLEYEFNEIVDRALRAQVIVNTFDARGLYVVIPFGDASHGLSVSSGTTNIPPAGKGLILVDAASA